MSQKIPRMFHLQKADLLVTETFDAGAFGEHVLETLDHAWKYLLNKVILNTELFRLKQKNKYTSIQSIVTMNSRLIIILVTFALFLYKILIQNLFFICLWSFIYYFS